MLSDLDLYQEWVLRGDEESFEILFDRHHPALVAYARSLQAPNPREAVSQAWMALVTRETAKRLLARRDLQSLRAWLRRVVLRRSQNQKRDRARHARLVDPGIIDAVAGRGEEPAARLEREERRLLLDEAIAALVPHYRSVVELRRQGVGPKLTAQTLGISLNAQRNRFSRGMEAVRDHVWRRRARP